MVPINFAVRNLNKAVIQNILGNLTTNDLNGILKNNLRDFQQIHGENTNNSINELHQALKD